MEGYFLAYQPFEDGGFSVAYRHMAPIRDLGSLDELREAVRGRGRRAISALRAQYDQLRLDSPPTQAQTEKKTTVR